MRRPQIAADSVIAALSLLGSVGVFLFSYFRILPFEHLRMLDPPELWAAYEARVRLLDMMLPWPVLGAVVAVIVAWKRRPSGNRRAFLGLLLGGICLLAFFTWIGAVLVGFDYD